MCFQTACEHGKVFDYAAKYMYMHTKGLNLTGLFEKLIRHFETLEEYLDGLCLHF